VTVRKVVAAGGLAATTLIGGAIGAAIVGSADAATPTPSPTATAGSNEDPTHEAGETAADETAENNGTARHHGGPGGMRGGSNEDPAHEAAESPEREAQENAAPSGGSAPSTESTPSPTASPVI
jgi:hypothetical protein